MFEVYCDSSYNESEDSYIGCTVLRDGRQIHQSTTKVRMTLKVILIVNLQPLILQSPWLKFFLKMTGK